MGVSLYPRPPRREWDERAAFAAMFLAIFGSALWFPFHRNPYTCTFKQVTGYPCFTCGMTRAWVDQIHGLVAQGFVQSPLGSVLFYLAVGFTAWTVARLVLRLPSLRFEIGKAWAIGLWALGVGALLVNWLYAIVSGVA